EGISANPDQRICELPLLSEADRHQLLAAWNDTRAEYPCDKCLHELFEQQVARAPGATAVICGGERLTYRELNERAERLGARLRRLGIGPDKLAGICLERTSEMAAATLAVLKAGGADVPLDPALPRERLAMSVAASRMPLILTARELAQLLPPTAAKRLCREA